MINRDCLEQGPDGRWSAPDRVGNVLDYISQDKMHAPVSVCIKTIYLYPDGSIAGCEFPEEGEESPAFTEITGVYPW